MQVSTNVEMNWAIAIYDQLNCNQKSEHGIEIHVNKGGTARERPFGGQSCAFLVPKIEGGAL